MNKMIFKIKFYVLNAHAYNILHVKDKKILND